MTRELAIRMISGEVLGTNEQTHEAVNMAIEALKSVRVKGEWEVVDYAEPRRYGCSICRIFVWHPTNYCPNCGARMKGKNDD